MVWPVRRMTQPSVLLLANERERTFHEIVRSDGPPLGGIRGQLRPRDTCRLETAAEDSAIFPSEESSKGLPSALTKTRSLALPRRSVF